MATHQPLCFLSIFLLFTNFTNGVFSQQCGSQSGGATCANNLCCSKYGFCGTTDDYCGSGCQSGPCASVSATPAGDGDVSSIITSSVFYNFLYRSNSNDAGCDSHGFYTYEAFLEAAGSFNGFGATGTELAAFFANVAHETGSGCNVNELPSGRSPDYGNYYGRGPLQLTHDYNYRAAGNYLNQDLIDNPDLLSTDNVLSFKASLWFWMTNGPHDAMVSGQGFGATIRYINSGECSANNGEQQDRITIYQSFCSTLGVDPGSNLSC